ncbi:MAG: PSD1 and planctomycete cytochrome C domain-containing protein [Bryobacter sp.]|nr:PSD1 and planctomycete cytochrome C domain-containing protein [Bryobacter sp.]
MRKLWVAWALWGSLPLAAADAEKLFRESIQPVLARDCQGCHGKQQALAKLDLSSRKGLLKGGTRGPALVPGKPEESLLLHVLEGRNKLQMPPGGPKQKLSAETVAAFRAWVEAGAAWPQIVEETRWKLAPEDLWAYQPLRPLPPGTTIDHAIQAGLKQQQLTAAPPADRRTLLRRVSINLTGLPPTAAETEAFLADRSPQAWENVVDRLLASPRYGERWARHWLDVVRYADSSGYSNDFERPNAWRYRDYVIRSFNQDKPYDQFIREQIAGDELYPENPEALIATGFLRAGPWEHTAMSVEAVTRQLFLDDVTHSTVNVFLGLTLGCAKCHDHKFDPLPTKDYYRVQAIFASTEFTRPPVPFLASENTRNHAAGLAYVKAQYEHARARMAELDPKKNPGQEQERTETFKLFQKHMQLFKESLDRYAPKAFAVASGPSDEYPDGGNNMKYPKRADYKPAVVHILPGGNIQSPAEPVTPGVLSLLEKYGNYPSPQVPDTVAGRRSVLAQWIANPKNPLTARVMVNRVWQYHFGKGLAGDTSNFGKMGKKPTHPELLDTLAARFVEQGWSLKKLHREILLSEVYQRVSRHPEHAQVAAKDQENHWLAYFPVKRVEAEVLRDSILAVSGELNLEAGGPGVFPQINEDVARQPQHRMGSLAPAYAPSPTRRERNRRSIYTFQQRSLVDPFVEVFNAPSLDLTCERREASTVPTQAFTLFNSQFVHDMALAWANRLAQQAKGPQEQVTLAYQQAFQRKPTSQELQWAMAHLAQQRELHDANPPAPRPAAAPLVHKITSELTGEQFSFTQPEAPALLEPNLHPSEVNAATRALADLALVLFNTSEFVYVY